MKKWILPLAVAGVLLFPEIAHAQHFGIFNNQSNLDRIDLYHNDMLHSLEVQSMGAVELNDDDTDIRSMAPNAFVTIKTRDWLTWRELKIKGSSDGKIERSFEQQGRVLDYEEYGKSWLAMRLPEIVRFTGLGAASRVRRIISQNGLDAAIREIETLESNHARRVYFNAVLAAPELTPSHTQRAVRTVARGVSSSSRLGEILIETAAKFPDDSSLTVTLILAVKEISSSTKQAETLIRIASTRRLSPDAAIAYAKAVQSISSSSAQAEALTQALDHFPKTDETVMAYCHAVRDISSSSSQGEAFRALLRSGTLTRDGYLAVIKSIEAISSSTAQGSVLEALAGRAPNDDVIWLAYLDAVPKISSSSVQGEVVMAMLERSPLSKLVLNRSLETSENDISSESVKREIRKLVIEKLGR